MRILLATHNPHKADELGSILGTLESITLLTLDDLPARPAEPVEDGATLEANAYIKAAEIFAATGIPTIADDTGLEVAALGGAPGVYSARYAGEGGTYADNCRKLIAELEHSGAADRSALFRTVICYTDGDRTLLAEGSVRGMILPEPRGAGGFGYDPLFQPEGSSRTFAEMDAAEKNAVSHRGRALAALHEMLAPYFDEGQ
ncbi:MAG TPA: RdgB/HAM1 family non-canonical purine NTP pyrophosphatase [Candidatus Kapabacteria bacterium]|nr:RdgB/HAM1 family non-canonical purine NTP pyrophosphatase [Candidatus Kapabacteria bacterium]